MSTENKSEIIIFKTSDDRISVDVRFEGETVWLTQAQLVELYDSSKANVSEYIKHILEEGELEESSVVQNFRTTADDGKSYQTKYYNLDMIISLLEQEQVVCYYTNSLPVSARSFPHIDFRTFNKVPSIRPF